MLTAIRSPARSDTRNLKAAAIIEKANAIRQVVSLLYLHFYYFFLRDFKFRLGLVPFVYLSIILLYGTGSGE
jgi:hypothetical protein